MPPCTSFVLLWLALSSLVTTLRAGEVSSDILQNMRNSLRNYLPSTATTSMKESNRIRLVQESSSSRFYVPRYDRVSPFDFTVVRSNVAVDVASSDPDYNIISNALAKASSSNVVWNVDDSIFPANYDLSKSSARLPLVRRSESPLSSQSPLTDPFTFRVECIHKNKTLCDVATVALRSASRRLAKDINFYQNVVVRAKLTAPCDTSAKSTQKDGVDCTNDKSIANFLAGAAPSAYFEGQRVDGSDDTSYFAYPQALLKQMNTNIPLPYLDYDIFIVFNLDNTFYLSNSNRPIGGTEYDIDFTLTHELSHGMGFDTALLQPNSSSYLIPNLNYTIAYNSTIKDYTATVHGWRPVTPYDSHMYSVPLANSTERLSIAALAQSIANSFPPAAQGEDIDAFLARFAASNSEAYQTATKIFSIATAGERSLAFRPSPNVSSALFPSAAVNGSSDKIVQIFLQTSKDYRPGTSIGHVDQARYQDTPSFLMVPSYVGLGSTFDQIIAQRNVSNATVLGTTSQTADVRGVIRGVYGPAELAILRTLGWPTPEFPSTVGIAVKTVLMTNDDGSSVWATPVSGATLLGSHLRPSQIFLAVILSIVAVHL
ncbi:hypothetical protein BJ742DRAFT_822368 [Cladochytrium replicatum]|nr:hypothetical protein BJ742DRAFT_822368 [Cladochytrium replicatum]